LIDVASHDADADAVADAACPAMDGDKLLHVTHK